MNMEKKKLRFNFVDVIIILLIVAVFFVGYKIINKNFSAAGNAPEVYFTVEVKAMPETYKDMFAEGDVVRDAIKGDTLGEVVNVESKPATDLYMDGENGKFVVSEYEGVEDVYVTIKGTPTSSGANIVIAQQEIKVGNMMYFKKPGCVGKGYIVKMEVKEAEGK